MSVEPTPEEKLLKIIKSHSVESQKIPSSDSLETASLNVSLSPRPLRMKSIRSWIPILTRLNRIVILIIASAAVLLLYPWIVRRPLFPSRPGRSSLLIDTDLTSPSSAAQPKFDEFQTILNARNYFKNMGEPPPITASQKVTSIADLSKSLYVSGIINGDDIQAVVEDKATGQIYYVRSGDYIGSLQVVSVGEGSILLKYGDEETQLTL